MNALIEDFEMSIRENSKLRTRRLDMDNGVSVHINGEGGVASVDFFTDGNIVGTIDSHVFHSWECMPSTQDIRSAVRKIIDLLD